MGRRVRVGARVAVVFNDFRKGVDLSRAESEVRPPYVPGAVNFTGRGRAAVQRWGVSPLGQTTAEGRFIYHSPIFPTKIFVQEGTTLYEYTDLPGLGLRTSRKVFSTAATISAVDFVTGAGAAPCIVFVHPVDGVFTWNGTTFALATAAVKGTDCAVWQNKVWVIEGSTPRFWWSNAGRADVWTTSTDFNQIRDLNNESLTAVGVGNGIYTLERTGLLAFKRQSAHLIIDSQTGEYQTLDTRHGAMSAEAVTTALGRVFCSDQVGIYEVTSNGMVEIGQPVMALRTSTPFRYDVAWTVGDRVYFSDGASDVLLEYVVPQKAWWPHVISGASSGVISATGTSNGTSGIASLVPYLLAKAGTTTYVVQMWYPPDAVGGALTDITGAVQSTLRLPMIDMNGIEFRCDRAIVRGWGGGAAGESVTPTVYSNGQDAGTARTALTLGGSAVFETAGVIVNQLGVHRMMQLALSATAADTNESQTHTGLTTPPSIVPLGITSVRFDLIPME